MQIPRKMSAHNVMASISRTLGTRHGEGKAANEVKLAGEESKDRLYEPKHKQKLVRVLTVVAYIISVSLAAIVLSLYYMYIWDPSDHPHYMAIKQRANASSPPPAVTASTARTPCLDAVSPAEAGLQGRIDGIPFDKTTPLGSMTTQSSRPSDDTSSQYAGKSIYKILTTPPSERILGDLVAATDLPPIPSISSDQFQAESRDDYHDGTAVPADDLMDD